MTKILLRWLTKLLLWLLGIGLIGIAVISSFAIPLDLSGIRKPMEQLIGSVLDREVKIEKSITVTTSLTPAFSIEGLRIFNPDAFTTKTFIHLDKALVSVELLPLLAQKLHIANIKVKGLELNLERTDENLVNWAISFPEKTPAPAPGASRKERAAKDNRNQFEAVEGDALVVRKLHLSDITVHYLSPDTKTPYSYELSECTGRMNPGEPLDLQADGTLDTFPYHLNITLASLKEFLSLHQTWLKLTADIAQTSLSFSGNVNFKTADRALTLKTGLHGQDLSSLNALLGVELPPFASYQLKTTLSLKPGIFEMQNLTVSTADSILEGSAILRRKEHNYLAEVNLLSKRVQLDDFFFEDWSWQEDTTNPAATGTTSAKKEKRDHSVQENTGDILKLTDPEFLSRFDLTLQVESKEVLSGQDNLGDGTLVLALKDGRLSLAPLQLNLPGGTFKLQASVKPGVEDTAASLNMQVENFDIGILARRLKPDTDMSGRVNLDTKLTSTASTLSEILANGNGYFDFSGQLKNINAGLIDLWAVNLITAIVAGTGADKSKINCAVCRWTVKDGLLTPDTFFIDTSKIRICGSGKVDFKTNRVNLTATPSPKRPEFFNLAAPVQVRGTFQDIHFALERGALVGHVIVFLTSPIHVPIRRLFEDDIPADGSDACDIALGSENRGTVSVRGCR